MSEVEELKLILKLIIGSVAIVMALLVSVGLSISAGYDYRRRTKDWNADSVKFVVDHHLKFYLKVIFFAMVPCLILIGVVL